MYHQIRKTYSRKQNLKIKETKTKETKTRNKNTKQIILIKKDEGFKMKNTNKTVAEQIKTMKRLEVLLMVIMVIDIVGTIVSWVTGGGHSVIPVSVLCAMSCCLIALSKQINKLESEEATEKATEETKDEQ